MISVTDLRAGTFFEDYGNIFQVLSYEHIKMGRGSANIKIKVRNIRSAAITEKSFISGAKVHDIHISKKELQYLYKDDERAYFMDPVTFEQISVVLKILGNDYVYLKEGMNFSISFYQNEPLSLALPPKMDLEVVETGPSIRGNTTSNIYKDAVLENGIKTKVPLFVDVGDKIRIDTRTGAYSEKA